MLTGREKELRIFRDAGQDDHSRFIAVYGRRRIGKTFLIREAFGYRFTFQHAGISGGSLSEQLYAFEASLREAGREEPGNPHNWLEAFEDLKDLIRGSKETRKVLFIDELSWMDTQNCDLMSALENFWNGWASARKDIVLIVCTSATSWMLNKVIHNKGGLYHRLTDRIPLEPFTLSECEEFTKENGISFNRDQILQYYMIFGGVPYYWSLLQKGLSLSQNVDDILFAKNAPLKDEFEYLYASIYRKPEDYITIVRTLSKKKIGMTREELIRGSGIPNSGDLTKKLDELESCGFIRKYLSFGNARKNAVYQLMDCFTLFYYQFLEKNVRDEHFWSHQINTPKVNTWMGLAFERVVLHHIDEIRDRLGISGIYTEVNAWYTAGDEKKGIPGAQIDLLIARKDQVINLCEMKYCNSEYRMSAEDDRKMKNRIDVFTACTKTKYAIYPTLITTYGVVENSYSGNLQSVITLNDLFRR